MVNYLKINFPRPELSSERYTINLPRDEVSSEPPLRISEGRFTSTRYEFEGEHIELCDCVGVGIVNEVIHEYRSSEGVRKSCGYVAKHILGIWPS